MIDASVLVDGLTGDLALLEMELHAPALVDYEVAQAVCAAARRRSVDDRIAEEFLDEVLRWRIARHEARFLLPRAWALRDSLSAYDASYVALAELLGAPLWTHDRRLARAAERSCDVVTD